MSRFFTFLKKEILEMLPPTLFFLVVFHLVVFTRALMDDSPGASLFSSTAATIGALIMGKSILIADALPVWYLLERQRMIYLVVSRTVCYALIALLFQFLEELIPLARSAGSVGAGLARLWEEIHWHRFWATHITILIFLAFYNTIAVVVEALGRDRFRSLMFEKPSPNSGKNG